MTDLLSLFGGGLPLVMVPALSLVMPAPQAISLLAIPVLAAKLWQAIDLIHAPPSAHFKFWNK
jgi:uncharacterized membrane protein YfcA